MSGQELGSVVDLVIEDEGQQVIQYEVKRGLKSSFLISRDQVASMTEEQVVVYDTAVPKEDRQKKESPLPSIGDTVAASEVE